MNKYVKPMVLANDELAEGVYAASGCWSAGGYATQNYENGRVNYCVQINGLHADVSGHASVLTITIVFDQPVKFDYSNGCTYVSGDGSTTLKVTRDINANNPNQQLGFGDLYVTYAGVGEVPATLSVIEVTISD